MKLRARLCLALALVYACEPRSGEQVAPDPIQQPATEPLVAEPEPAPEPEAPRVRGTVIVIPLRSFPDDLLDAVEAGLRAELDVDVVRHEMVELPEEAYYPPRKRYRAEKLLDFLEPYADREGHNVRVLGVTEVDISTTSEPYEDWGIFGLGTSGTAAVMSSKRLTRKPKNREHVRFRVSTIAIHEIGHTFGLPHCNEHAEHCAMLDAEGGIENTDTSSGTLGPSCRAKLDKLTGWTH